MHSIWFAVLVVLIVHEFGGALPVDVDHLNNNDSETRLIVPPEMTPNYFELLKVKSEKETNYTENSNSTPMNFLKSTKNNATKMNSMDQKPLMSFDGSKQSPIFITIPIYISSAGDGIPLIAATIEKINIPSSMAMSKKSEKEAIKAEDKIKEESLPLAAEELKQELPKN